MSPQSITLLYGGRSIEHRWSIQMLQHLMQEIKKDEQKRFLVSRLLYLDTTGKLSVLDARMSDVLGHDQLLEHGTTHETHELPGLLNTSKEFVFSLLQGQDGEDGTAQGLGRFFGWWSSLGSVLAAAVSEDKAFQAVLVSTQAPNLSSIKTVALNTSSVSAEDIERVRPLFGSEVVLKPNRLGGSFKTTIVPSLNEREVLAYAESMRDYDSKILVQERIHGVEHSCGILYRNENIEVLPILRFQNPRGFLSHEQKTVTQDYLIEFDVDPQIRERIKSISVNLAALFRVTTFCRFDYIVDSENKIYFLENNISPGLTENSVFPIMLRRAKISLPDVIESCANTSRQLNLREASRILAADKLYEDEHAL